MFFLPRRISAPHRKDAMTTDGNCIKDHDEFEPASWVRLLRWPLIISFTLLFFCNSGGYYWDSHATESSILLMMLSQDPSLFSHDIIFSSGADVGHVVWFRLVGILLGLIPIYVLYLVLHLLSIFLLVAAVYHLALCLFDRDETAGIAAAFLLCWYPQNAILGRATLIEGYFYEAHLSTGLIVWALLLAIRNRPVWALVLVGLSINIHSVQGMHAFLILLSVFCLRAKWDLPLSKMGVGKLALGIVCFLCLASPELFPLFKNVASSLLDVSPATTGQISSRDFVEIVGHIRTPHHFIPTKYPFIAYFATIFVTLSAFLSWWLSCPQTASRSRAILMISVIVLLCLIAFPLIEVSPVVMMAHFFRATKFLWVLSMALTAGFLVRLLRGGPLLLKVGAAVCFFFWSSSLLFGPALACLCMCLAYYYPEKRWKLGLLASGSLILVIPLLPKFAGISFSLFRYDMYFVWLFPLLIVAVSSGGMRRWFLLWATALYAIVGVYLAYKTPIRATPRPPADPAVYNWIKAHTTKDDIVMIPPADSGLLNFWHYTHRSVFVSYWKHPLRPDLVGEWYRRLNLLSREALEENRKLIVAGTMKGGHKAGRMLLTENYLKLSAAELVEIGKEYGVRYCMVPIGHNSVLPVLFAGKHYQVLDLVVCPGDCE